MELNAAVEPGSPEVIAPKPPRRGRPKWEDETRERVRAAIRRFQKPLADLQMRDANEGDTRLVVTDFLCEGLGFDKYSDLTTEYMVKGDYADYGVRIDQEMIAFIEVKRIGTKLTTKHLRQAEMYALNEGVEWVWLTSGTVWQVYHLTGGLPVQVDLVLNVDLLGDMTGPKKADLLFYMTRESLKRHGIQDFWEAKRATSPLSLTQTLMSEPVMAAMRKELRRQTGHNVETDEIVRLLKETVIRKESLPS